MTGWASTSIAALPADAASTADTDWVQVVEWYDELLAFTDSPVARLNRAVADRPRAGLAALADLDRGLPRYSAVTAYLHERTGELALAAHLYAEAARAAHECTRTRPPHSRGRPGAATAAVP